MPSNERDGRLCVLKKRLRLAHHGVLLSEGNPFHGDSGTCDQHQRASVNEVFDRHSTNVAMVDQLFNNCIPVGLRDSEHLCRLVRINRFHVALHAVIEIGKNLVHNHVHVILCHASTNRH